MLTLSLGIDTITHLAFNAAGTQLVATGFGGIGLAAWPLSADKPFATVASPEKVVHAAWHPRGQLFAIASPDGVVQL